MAIRAIVTFIIDDGFLVVQNQRQHFWEYSVTSKIAPLALRNWSEFEGVVGSMLRVVYFEMVICDQTIKSYSIDKFLSPGFAS